jgi:hypothetical protein
MKRDNLSLALETSQKETAIRSFRYQLGNPVAWGGQDPSGRFFPIITMELHPRTVRPSGKSVKIVLDGSPCSDALWNALDDYLKEREGIYREQLKRLGVKD